MLKLITYIISFFLILIIFLRMPKDSAGLSSFTTRSNLLGSPSSARKILNILTAIGIFLYFLIAIQTNLTLTNG